MVKRITRRMRCEVQGCHKSADYGLGLRGNDYPLCEAHLKSLVEEAVTFFNVQTTNRVEKASTKAEIQRDIESQKDSEYFECKWCGEKFSKAEYTNAKFATHARLCKKEHQAEDE